MNPDMCFSAGVQLLRLITSRRLFLWPVPPQLKRLGATEIRFGTHFIPFSILLFPTPLQPLIFSTTLSRFCFFKKNFQLFAVLNPAPLPLTGEEGFKRAV